MIDVLTIYNLAVKYPNTVDLVREVEKMVRAEAIDEFLLRSSTDISFRSISDRIGCMEIFKGIADELKEKNNETDGCVEHN